MLRQLITLGLSSLLCMGMSARRQTAPAREHRFEISIASAREPAPALRYRLMPALFDRTPGNAAPVYFMAALVAPKMSAEQDEHLSSWSSASVAELPRAEVDKLLAAYTVVFAQLDTAARREYCRWEPAFNEQQFGALLSHLGPLRDCARALALKARMQIADGKFDDAARTLQTGYAMAYHVQSDGVLIQSLVGAAMARTFDAAVRDWQAAPNSPNLYWALAELPRPFVDIASAMRLEQALLVRMFPILKDPDRATGDLLRDAIDRLNELAAGVGEGGVPQRVELALIIGVTLPPARAALIESGWEKAKVDSLAPADAVAIHFAREFRWFSDDQIKWLPAPYPESAQGLKDLDERIRAKINPRINPLLSFLPAIRRSHTTAASVDRELAALQTIEALRAHAAANGNKLPTALEDMLDPPAVMNPMTGKMFDYRLDGDSAILSDASDEKYSLEYVIRIRK